MSRTALIIGASGQDGSFLTAFLLKKNYNVVCTSRSTKTSGYPNHIILGIEGNVEYVTLNPNDTFKVIEILNRYKPDEIYNLAAQSSVGLSFKKPIETFESIVFGTINILEGIKSLNLKTKLFNAGSCEAYGNHGKFPIREETTRKPVSPYGISKSSVQDFIELYRNSYSIFACTGILFNHESHLRGGNFVTRKIIETAVKIKKGFEKNLTLGNLDIHRDWGWAPEYVEAMWLMLQLESPEDFIIATGKTHSLKDFVNNAFSILGLDYREYTKTNNDFYRPQDIIMTVANPSKSFNIIGWKAKVDFNSLIDKLVDNELKKYNKHF